MPALGKTVVAREHHYCYFYPPGGQDQFYVDDALLSRQVPRFLSMETQQDDNRETKQIDHNDKPINLHKIINCSVIIPQVPVAAQLNTTSKQTKQ